jgi:hypothetical protein
MRCRPCGSEGTLNFSLVTNNDDMVQIDVNKSSDGLPASILSARWEMFAPGTRDAVITKEGSDVLIVDRTIDGTLYPDSAIKFLVEHTDTEDLGHGEYPHEATIVTTDGRIHTVTEGGVELMNGIVTIRNILTPPPNS